MKHRRTRDIVIELTSLLDVVMILIFAVMIENTRLMRETKVAAGISKIEAETAIEERTEALLRVDELNVEIDNLNSQIHEQEEKKEALVEAYEQRIAEIKADYEAKIKEAIADNEQKIAELNKAHTEENLQHEKEKSDLLENIDELIGNNIILSEEKAGVTKALEELQKKYEEQTEELLVALTRIDRMDIDELTARLQAAESTVKNYEYMEEVAVVINVTLDTEKIEDKYFGYLTYSSGTGNNQAQEAPIEFHPGGENPRLSLENLLLKAFLKDEIEKAFSDEAKREETRVYIFFSFPENVTYGIYKPIEDAVSGAYRFFAEEEYAENIKLKYKKETREVQ